MDHEDSRRTVTCLHVLSEVSGQSVQILAEEDTGLALGPEQDCWVRAPERQIRRIADTNDIDRQRALGIVPHDGHPEWTAQVLVQKEAQH